MNIPGRVPSELLSLNLYQGCEESILNKYVPIIQALSEPSSVTDHSSKE